MSRLTEELAIVGVALQFLTRLPSPGSLYTPERFSASIRWFPLVGVIVGGIGAFFYWLAAYALPPVIAALVSTAATLLVTGAFHEDGLADLFDGLGAASRELMLEVMRDSRLGTFGAAALALVLGTKIAAVASLPIPTAVAALVGGHAVSRASAVVAIASSRYVRASGTGKSVADGIGGGGLLVALFGAAAGMLALAGISGVLGLVAAVLGAAAGHVGIRLLYERRLGGYTGDCLGAVQQLSEVGFYLGLLAWL